MTGAQFARTMGLKYGLAVFCHPVSVPLFVMGTLPNNNIPCVRKEN